MRLILTRFLDTDRDGTFGLLEVPGAPPLFTVERAWADNVPRISCVPAGLYDLEPHSSERFPDTWALVGGTVSHYPSPECSRSAILIHAANRCGELHGCIAPGTSMGTLDGDLAVLSSRDAMVVLRQVLASAGPHRIEIQHGGYRAG